MDQSEIYQAITPVFQDILDDDDLVLKPEMTAGEVDEWDSLRHIQLVVAVEQLLAIKFTPAEITDLENVGQFVGLVQAKLG
jgi:acyl carrier protein